MIENISIVGKIHKSTITEPQTHKIKTHTTSLRASQAYLDFATNMKNLEKNKFRRSWKQKRAGHLTTMTTTQKSKHKHCKKTTLNLVLIACSGMWFGKEHNDEGLSHHNECPNHLSLHLLIRTNLPKTILPEKTEPTLPLPLVKIYWDLSDPSSIVKIYSKQTSFYQT